MNFRELITEPFSGTERKKKRQLLSESKVFCMAPWLQLHAQTNGKVAPCCMSAVAGGNEIGDLRVNPNLEDAWNSPNMKQLRQNMMQGKESSLCTHCYDYEKTGKFSERMQYNRDFPEQFSKVTATKQDGSVKGLDVPLIDIRFSNKCNYKCRICDSAFSTLWFDEEALINRPRRPPTIDTEKEINAATDPVRFWESYKKLLPNVKRLHFAGGEPLFMDEHYAALEHLISIGKTDVTLSYNTNFSTLRYKKYDVIEMWNKFSSVDVWASLDMMGEKGDYQRKGQRWSKVEENIRAVQERCKTLIFGVNITVSILNMLDIPSFYQYLVENELVQPERVNLYLLFDPPYFNITNLTPALKREAIKRFEAFKDDYLPTLPDTEKMRNHVSAVLAYMQSEDGALRPEFRHWINAVDKLREESFTNTFPELAEMVSA